MISKLRQEIIEFLQKHEVGHLALSGPDGPWASIVRYMNHNLTLYLIERRTSDLIYYLENDPHIVFTVEGSQESVQLFGTAQVLTVQELHRKVDKVQANYRLKDRPAPGVYVVVEVKPERVYRLTHDNGATHRDTMDINTEAEG